MKLNDIIDILKSGGIENARMEASLLIERFCNIRAENLLPMADAEFDSSLLLAAAKKRASSYPLQYIIGSVGFYGLDFYIKEGCLIPRSDTEILVEKAISLIPRGAHFTDACCGSGCIAISILKHRPDLKATAIDLYGIPLALTAENARLHGVEDRLEIKKCDVLSFDFTEALKCTDFLISNPPYIRTDVMKTLDKVVLAEPSSALDGGDDGMLFYRALVAGAEKQGLSALFEIGYDQADDISALAEKSSYECEIYKDYSSNDRVAYLNTKQKRDKK